MEQIRCSCSHCGTRFMLPPNIAKLTIRYLRENGWIVKKYKNGFYMSKPETALSGHSFLFSEDVDSWEFTSFNLRMLSRLSYILEIDNMCLLNRILYDHEEYLRGQLTFWKSLEDMTPEENGIERLQQRLRIKQLDEEIKQEVKRKVVSQAYKDEELEDEKH